MNAIPWRTRMFDTFANLLSKLGTGADKTTMARYTMFAMDKAQQELAYRADWVARKVVDIPAKDATRAWRSFQADNADITLIEDLEKDMQIQVKTKKAMSRARLYGGGALIIGVDDGLDMREPLIFERIKKDSLKFVHVVSRHEIAAGEIDDDILSPNFGQPKIYQRSGIAGNVEIHPSRVVRLIGNEIPDITTTGATDQGWGDSVLQVVDDAVRHVGLVSQSGATLMQELNFDILKIPGLTSQMGTNEYETRLINRLTFANNAKSVVNGILIDKDEEWERNKADLAGLPDVLRVYLLIASGACDIPATRMLGQSPTGLSATGESDIRNYYDGISSYQETDLRPALNALDEALVRSALGAFPDDIYYEWNELWQLDEVQKATIAKSKADTWRVDVDSGVLNEDVLRTVRYNQVTEDGLYPGIEDAIEEHGEEPEEPEVPPGSVIGPDGEPIPPKPIVPGQTPPAQAANENEQELFRQQRRRAADALDGIHNNQMQPRRPRGVRGAGKFAEMQRRGPLGIEPPHEEEEDEQGRRSRTYHHMTRDATPRTLYLRRDVLNGADIINHYKKQNGSIVWRDPSSLHVTIAYSRQPVDWMKIGSDDWSNDEKGRMVVKQGGIRLHEVFGADHRVLVLAFTSRQLTYRNEDCIRLGCDWAWGDYQPHITLADAPEMSFDEANALEPYTGEIILGPEIAEEIDEQWRVKVTADGWGDAKQTKTEVNYREATDAARCGVCTHFIVPNGCELVAGKIMPEDVCDLVEVEVG